MRTQAELDEKLIGQVLELGHFSTRKAAVHTALAEILKILKRKEILSSIWKSAMGRRFAAAARKTRW